MFCPFLFNFKLKHLYHLSSNHNFETFEEKIMMLLICDIVFFPFKENKKLVTSEHILKIGVCRCADEKKRQPLPVFSSASCKCVTIVALLSSIPKNTLCTCRRARTNECLRAMLARALTHARAQRHAH